MKTVCMLLLAVMMAGAGIGQEVAKAAKPLKYEPTILEWIVLKTQPTVTHLNAFQQGTFFIDLRSNNGFQEITLYVNHQPVAAKDKMSSCIRMIKDQLAKELGLTLLNMKTTGQFIPEDFQAWLDIGIKNGGNFTKHAFPFMIKTTYMEIGKPRGE